jgi:hypothetical protein
MTYENYVTPIPVAVPPKISMVLDRAVTEIMGSNPTPGMDVLLDRLIITQILKKFLASYRNRKFIMVFSRTRH